MEKGRIEAEGWKLASTTSGDHLKRTLEMYDELGFDILTVEVSPEEYGECTECFVVGDETIYRVYTRTKDEPAEIE